jgi:hypothetical protein
VAVSSILFKGIKQLDSRNTILRKVVNQ